MIDFISNNWLALFALVFVFWLLRRIWSGSDHQQYADVIAKSKNDPKCKYWLEGRKQERDFTAEERREIYARDGGICQVSGKRVKNDPKGFFQHIIYWVSHIPGWGFLWLNDLGEIDHIVFNSYRGPKERKKRLDNGRLVRRIINRKRSNKPDRAFFEKLREWDEKVYLGKKDKVTLW